MKASKRVGHIDVRRTPEEVLKEKKLDAILQKVLKDIPQEEQEKMLLADNRLRNLNIDKKKAEEKGKHFSKQIIEKQILARTKDLLWDKVANRLLELVKNGNIMRYLEKEEQEKLLCYRNRTMMLLDAVDSSFKDMSDVLNSVGIGGDLIVSAEISKARESIDKYIKFNTSHTDNNVRTMMLEEADRVYEYAGKRVPFFDRKIDRYITKKNKEQKDNDAAHNEK